MWLYCWPHRQLLLSTVPAGQVAAPGPAPGAGVAVGHGPAAGPRARSVRVYRDSCNPAAAGTSAGERRVHWSCDLRHTQTWRPDNGVSCLQDLHQQGWPAMHTHGHMWQRPPPPLPPPSPSPTSSCTCTCAARMHNIAPTGQLKLSSEASTPGTPPSPLVVQVAAVGASYGGTRHHA
jgi:hypothetical protein